MAYFGDVLESGDKRMDYEVEKPEKKDAIKMLTFKVKSAPSKKLAMSNGVDFTRGKGDGYDVKHKSEIKYRCTEEHESKFTVTTKDATYQWDYETRDFNKDGMHASVEVEAKCVPTKPDWEAKVEAKIGGYEVGGVEGWTEVSREDM